MGNKEIAITGMSCVFPGAYDLDTYWKNILAGKSAIGPIPKNRNIDDTVADADDSDRIVCTHGGFLDAEIPFSPLEYGIMPRLCDHGDPEQLLTLQMSYRALKDTGIDPEKEDLKNTEIIIGRGGYLGNSLQQGYQKIEVLPQIMNVLQQLTPGVSHSQLGKIKAELKSCFAHLTTDRVSLGIPNLNTSRIAHRFNMMGANYTIDAACASALIAAENAVTSLRQERCDRVITGGIYLASNPTFWWVFSRLEALSTTGGIRPFSKHADGMLPGEGIGILVFERLEDAVKAGRRVYAVIKGIGSASDGQSSGLMAPRKEGQIECLRRAYRDAGIDPKTVDLLEGHGTATKVGDRIELEAINEFFGSNADGIPTHALGSVKSMIGHTMPASGAASLIKMALSVYHKVLPPTLCDDECADGLTGSSFYLNTAARPWVHPPGSKRRAGVNAFGFGGINGHAVLEEFEESGAAIDDLVMDWPTEIFLVAGRTLEELQAAIGELLEEQARYQAENKLFGLLSMAVCKNGNKFLDYRLAIIADNYQSLAAKLRNASELLKENMGQAPIQADDIYFEPDPLVKSGKIVYIFPGNAFPGLGDDYTARLGELCLYLPFFRCWFDLLDLQKSLPDRSYRYSTLMFPPTKIDHEKFLSLKKELRILDNSASGVFLANIAGYDLMSRLGIAPDMIAGTSLGEWSAAVTGGMIELDQIVAMDIHVTVQEVEDIKGAIGFSYCSLETLQPYFDRFNRDQAPAAVSCSMDLSPEQVVFAGTRDGVDRFCKFLKEEGVWSQYLNLFPIHTPVCQPIVDNVYRKLEGLRVAKPKIPVYSAATADQFPHDGEAVRRLLADNSILPVKMRSLFEKLHDDGARIFVQLGGGGKIAAPICETLKGRPFCVLSIDVANQQPVRQLQHVIATLYAHHKEMNFDVLFNARQGYLNRSVVEKSKRSEFVVNLKTTIPKFEINNPQLHLKPEVDEPAMSAPPDRQPSANAQAVEESADPKMSEWEEVLCEQMNTMTRMYALQKEDDLTDMTHAINMLQCQAQLILSGTAAKSQAPSTPAPPKADDR